jgi:hypothetical protein
VVCSWYTEESDAVARAADIYSDLLRTGWRADQRGVER